MPRYLREVLQYAAIGVSAFLISGDLLHFAMDFLKSTNLYDEMLSWLHFDAGDTLPTNRAVFSSEHIKSLLTLLAGGLAAAGGVYLYHSLENPRGDAG
jgi:hypothetical protein